MKEKYVAPELELVRVSDVIITSQSTDSSPIAEAGEA